MNSKIARNLSANSLQLLVNQLFGLLIFYVLSTTLDKSSFGHINWTLAVLLTGFNILSCGIDQLSIKKIATGEHPEDVLSIYLSHVLIAGMIFYLVIVLNHFFFPALISEHALLLLLGLGKLMIFFSSPFKQIAIGLEKFRALFIMSVGSNVIRGILLIILAITHSISITSIILIFIVGDTVELLLSIIIVNQGMKIPILIRWHGYHYFQLMKEALPQVGVVLFTSALARMDWIFVGVLASRTKLAEYSFAYKIFEVSTFPLLIIAPLLIPVFTRIFKNGDPGVLRVQQFKLLLTLEMIIACFISLVLYLGWVPVMDGITGGKYGIVNHSSILIFCVCMPLIYVNNFLWTLHFTSGRLKMIFWIFAITFMINVSGDLLLIPLYGNEGAALAYLAAMLLQMILFMGGSQKINISIIYTPLLICLGSAAIASLGAILLFSNIYIIIFMAICIYIFLLIIFKQFNIKYWRMLRYLLWKK